jgi:hypothetical protein
MEVNEATMRKYDAFISHASEDKASLVAGLAEILHRLGANVWYDEFTLEPGDSLSRSIDRGLAESRFGLVVLSKSFFAKDWPEYELRGLISRELGRDKVIIPVWHGVSREDVLEYSPPLADKLAIRSDQHDLMHVALAVLKVIRPDLLKGWHRKVLANKKMAESIKTIETAKILPGPIQHETLPQKLVNRILINTYVLQEVFPQTLEEALDSFRRDANPQTEVQVWELIAACYVRTLQGKPGIDERKKGEFFKYFLLRTMAPPEQLDLSEIALPSDDIEYLAEVFNSLEPKMLDARHR